METVTVFTPTYNRRDLLVRVYESLKRQTVKDFRWIVIDDGSEDATSEYVKELTEKESEFIIEYYYKENGGLHTGYNLAIDKIETELCMCCDSDDWLSDDSIEIIKKVWEKCHDESIAGIIGLDSLPSGQIIGKELPNDLLIDLNELYIKGKLVGDKKIVVRSELYKQLPKMRTINKEKNFNPNYYNVVISEKYKWIGINKILCYVDYQPDGMANSIVEQYFNSPNSFIELRKLYMSLKKATILFKIRHIIHYNAECLIAKRVKNVFDSSSPNRMLSVIFFPAGCLYYVYLLKNRS